MKDREWNRKYARLLLQTKVYKNISYNTKMLEKEQYEEEYIEQLPASGP